jgi:4-amino-4-deoxy-L-arabinose transferase-like glycosyltransferase
MTPRVALACCLVLSGALLASPLRGHIDDTDAQLYQVLARQMAAAHAWLEPGQAPASLRPFREHLPFGQWPSVAAIRLLGEGALPWLGLSFSLGTVALVLALGTRLVSLRAGVLAALLLACNETFFVYGARARLDPLLVLLATASAAPVLLGRLSGRGFLFAGAAGALAALVKGPFGLVPLGAVGGARALYTAFGPSPGRERLQKLFRALGALALLLAAAAAPAVIFLLWDRAHGASWWNGYVRDQVLASARGLRRDGETSMLFPFQSLWGRFWPGLPLVLLGVLQALRGLATPPETARPATAANGEGPAPEPQAVLRLLALASLLAVAALCLPGRKVWNHELVVYPLLALLGGAAADPLLRRLSRRAASLALVALTAAACALSLAGLGTRLLRPPCVASREFAARLDALPPGSPVLVASRDPDFRTIVGLTAERRLSPWFVRALPAAPAAPEGASPVPREEEAAHARIALAADDGEPPPAPWRLEGRARGWLLLSR